MFRDDDGPLLVGAVPAHDPHRAHQGPRAQEVRRHRARALHRRGDRGHRGGSTPPRAPRGAEPRWWEDVDEGDEVGPMVKGPLTVTDMICWHVGMGMGLYGVQAAAPRRPATGSGSRGSSTATTRTSPTCMQRVHWDPEFARAAGNPTTFDYGRMRETWLDPPLHRLDGRRRLAVEARLRVPAVQLRRRHPVDARHGRPQVPGRRRPPRRRPRAASATTSGARSPPPATPPSCCPSREHGPVRLPDPPGGATDLQGALEAIGERFASDERRRASVSGLDVERRGRAPPHPRPAREAQRHRRHDDARR